MRHGRRGERCRASFGLEPKTARPGSPWLGPNPQEGFAGFGYTPAETLRMLADNIERGDWAGEEIVLSPARPWEALDEETRKLLRF